MGKIEDLKRLLIEREEKISKASRIKKLIEVQKGFVKRKKNVTNFIEPVLFLARRDGKLEFYEKATAGKFVFEHSNGQTRTIELRPSDQRTMDYGDVKVRCYVSHEDRPYADWDNPIVDSQDVVLGIERINATNLKYQERMENLKLKSKNAWVYWVLGIALAIVIVMFGWAQWGSKIVVKETIEATTKGGSTAPPVSSII